MKRTRLLMGMPITIEIVDKTIQEDIFSTIFDYFIYVDETFSPFKSTSEVSLINQKKLSETKYSHDMKEVLALSQKTKAETDGYFDVWRNGKLDPSGMVKGWAILNAAKLLKKAGVINFYIDAGGDIQVGGKNEDNNSWRIGIRNPFNRQENVKVLKIEDKGVATSGTYIRGQHVYNPLRKAQLITDIVSLTVIGPDICEADRFATGAFAMGRRGIDFIEKLKGFEGYLIDKDGIATLTTGFLNYI